MRLDGSSRSGGPAAGTVLGKPNLPDAEIDQMIRKAAITNAALELLPEGFVLYGDHPVADAPRVPHWQGLWIRARSRRTRGFHRHPGRGLTSQYLEQFGRKLLGGLLGSLGGGLGRTLGRQTASSGLTFATTYALGRVAQRYYADGRKLDTAR